PMEDHLSAVPPNGKESSAARVQVRSVHRGVVVRQVWQARWRRQMNDRFTTLYGLAIASALVVSAPDVVGLSPATQTAAAEQQQGSQPAKPSTPSTTAPRAKRAAATRPRASDAKDWRARTPWGDPDLQGVWNDATSTPLQRPTELAGKDILTDEEAAETPPQTAVLRSQDRPAGPAQRAGKHPGDSRGSEH